MGFEVASGRAFVALDTGDANRMARPCFAERPVNQNDHIVDVAPCQMLLHDGMPMPAYRQHGLSLDFLEEAMRSGFGFYIVEEGAITEVFQGDDRRYVWETEFRPRLAPSVPCRVSLGDYPDGRCYTASEWVDERGARLFVFERFGT